MTNFDFKILYLQRPGCFQTLSTFSCWYPCPSCQLSLSSTSSTSPPGESVGHWVPHSTFSCLYLSPSCCFLSYMSPPGVICVPIPPLDVGITLHPASFLPRLPHLRVPQVSQWVIGFPIPPLLVGIPLHSARFPSRLPHLRVPQVIQ